MNDASIYSKIFYSTTKYLFLKNVFMFTAGILSIFIVRLLQPAEYGKWALVYQLVATIGPILSLGFLSTLAKFIPEYTDEKRKNELFSQALFVVTLAFLVFSLLYTAGTSLFPKILPQEIKIVKYPFLFFIGTLALVNLIEGFYHGLGKFNQWTTIDGGRSVLSAGLAILFILTLSKRFETVFYTYFFLIFLFLIVLFGSLRKNIYKVNPKFEPRIVKFSLIILAGQIVFLLGTTIDSVLLRVLLKDPAQVGYYNAGIRIPKMLETMFLSPLSVPFLYYFSHPDTVQSREKILVFGSKMLGIICGLISLFLFSFAKEIVLLLFGNGYSESIPVLRFFSLVLFIIGFIILFSPYFTSLNKPLIVVLGGVISITSMFILNLLLIPCLKSTGPAVSAVLGLIIQALVLLYILLKHKVMGFRNFIVLFFCVTVAVVSGFCLNFYITLLIFILSVLATQLFTLNDIETWQKIVKPK